MQDQNARALVALQAAKQQGLSYFEAAQSLKLQGFDQQAIDNASDKFDYPAGMLRSAQTPPHSITPEEHEAEKEKFHKELEAADEQLQQDMDNETSEFRGGLHRGL